MGNGRNSADLHYSRICSKALIPAFQKPVATSVPSFILEHSSLTRLLIVPEGLTGTHILSIFYLLNLRALKLSEDVHIELSALAEPGILRHWSIFQ